MGPGGAKWIIHFTPLAASSSNSGRNASTADFCEKSTPPPARSSGDLTGTPAAVTADVSAPSPAKNSQKRNRLGSKAATSTGGSNTGAVGPSRCLLVGPAGAHVGALRSTEGPLPSVTCAPHHLVRALPPLPLPCPLSLPPFPLPLPWCGAGAW